MFSTEYQQLSQFLFGFLGAVVYFVCVKLGFFQTSVDDTELNPNIFKPFVLIFFCGIGGLLPILFEINTPLGCFTQGLTIRPALTTLLSGNK